MPCMVHRVDPFLRPRLMVLPRKRDPLGDTDFVEDSARCYYGADSLRLLEENIVTFVKNELKNIQKLLSPDYPECSESKREGEDEEQRTNREAFLKITLHFLRRMKQDELANHIQSSKRISLKI
ncbi:hypothetical protein EPR50_G00032200 [Perca flavescens]|uniref:Uncharacterized protein n=1 Tax=Perca flavescens TaxID=8167 RepID=A0A484DK05_PERFV|nr:hypothetical protein EPR50_G00032200 [Perca flavescens]